MDCKNCRALEYERNKFSVLLADKERGIMEELRDQIALEMQAIRDLLEYVDGEDSRRIRRRLDRIERILHE